MSVNKKLIYNSLINRKIPKLTITITITIILIIILIITITTTNVVRITIKSKHHNSQKQVLSVLQDIIGILVKKLFVK